jgi:hypothetical protein
VYRSIPTVVFLLIPSLSARAEPEGLRVSTWVREDLFAGFFVFVTPQQSSQCSVEQGTLVCAQNTQQL